MEDQLAIINHPMEAARISEDIWCPRDVWDFPPYMDMRGTNGWGRPVHKGCNSPTECNGAPNAYLH